MSEASGYSHGASTTQYSVERAHSRIEGIIQLPVAGVAGVSFVRLHAPIERETIYWSATRRGASPIVPSRDAFLVGGNTNYVFLSGQRSACIPVPTSGGHWFVIAGYYEFALVSPIDLDSNMMLGSMPWEPINVNQNFIPKEFFDPRNIIGTGDPLTQPSPFYHPFYLPKTNVEPVQPSLLNPLAS